MGPARGASPRHAAQFLIMACVMVMMLPACNGRGVGQVDEAFTVAPARRMSGPDQWQYSEQTLERHAAVFDRLGTPMDLSLEAVPLDQALEQIASEAELPLHINWSFLEAEGIDRDQPVTVQVDRATAEECLEIVLYAASAYARQPARFAVIDGLVLVSTPRQFGELLYYRRGRL